MRTRINLTFFIVFLAGLFICASAQAAQPGDPIIIGYGFNPQIYGKKIVWQGTDGDIYLYDAEEVGPALVISNSSSNNSDPQIHGDYICWVGIEDVEPYALRVFLYDGVQCIKPGMAGGISPTDPQVSDELVVWSAYDGDNDEIYAYDISSGLTDKLTNDGYDNQHPQVSGEHVTWEGNNFPMYVSLFFYDFQESRKEKVREEIGVDNWRPQIYDDTIVWWGGVIYPDPIWYKLEIFMYDEGDDPHPVQITECHGTNSLVCPQIWDKKIVWDDPNHPYINFYDRMVGQIINIPSTCNYTFYPQIWDNQVVWEGLNEFWNYEIYFWDGSTTYNVSNSGDEADHAPQIYESDIVWQTDLGVIYFAEAEVLTEPDIEVSPLVYDFGEVWVNVTATTTVTISNEGNDDLTVEDIYLELGSLSDFTIRKKPNLPKVLEPDESVELTIAYRPSSAVSSADVLEIISDDPDEGLVEVSLSGEGVLYRDIAVSPIMYDFGEVQTGHSATTTVTISNVGNLLLTLYDIGFTPESSDAFSIVPEIDPNDFPLVLRTRGPRASIDIEIEFSPLDIGEKSAVLEIESNDPDEDIVEVSISGEGIE